MKHLHFLLFALFTPLASQSPLWAKGSDHPMPLVAVVSTTRDSGAGSLRAAIESANRNAGTRIVFRLPASASSLLPLSPLPALLKPNTCLEGNRQITILGDHSADKGIGLRVQASRCQIIGMKWRNWPDGAILVQASHTLFRDNWFNNTPVGIIVQGAKSRSNRFQQNVFEEVKTPISLRDGSNDGIKAPALEIVRDDAITPVSHRFTMRFIGKAKTDVTFELGYSANEAREIPQIQSTRETHTIKTDSKGVAVWQFNKKGYPVGSWTATATQKGSTSAFSNTVVLPYL